MLPIKNSLKQDSALENAIRKVQADQEGLKLNGPHQLLIYADAVNILGGNTHTTGSSRNT
jgi:hypothetical protein